MVLPHRHIPRQRHPRGREVGAGNVDGALKHGSGAQLPTQRSGGGFPSRIGVPAKDPAAGGDRAGRAKGTHRQNGAVRGPLKEGGSAHAPIEPIIPGFIGKGGMSGGRNGESEKQAEYGCCQGDPRGKHGGGTRLR